MSEVDQNQLIQAKKANLKMNGHTNGDDSNGPKLVNGNGNSNHNGNGNGNGVTDKEVGSLCATMSSNCVVDEDITTADWMVQIASDKLALELRNKDQERGKNFRVFHDVNEFISFIMNQEKHQKKLKSLLDRNTEKNMKFLVSFFENAIASFEPRIEGETQEDFELRRQEMTTELRAALPKFAENGFVGNLKKHLLDSFRTGIELYRQGQYRLAYFAFTDAILAAQSRPLDNEMCDTVFSDVICSEEGGKETFPHDTIYLELKMKQIECLILDEQFKKVSVYANHLLNWMTSHKACGVKGYYATNDTDKFSLLQIWMGEAEVALFNPFRAIDLCNLSIKNYCSLLTSFPVDRSLFNVRKTFLERLSDYFDADEDPEEVIQRDRSSAKIIVDQTARQGTLNGQFLVNNLDSGLKIAKDGDIIFIEEGTFVGRTLRQQAGNMKIVIEISKSVTLIGASAKKSIITGSIVKVGTGELRMRRLKLEIGSEQDQDADIYLLDGMTVIEGCVVECMVNTGFYVLSSETETSLTFTHCILDGLESCKRMVGFQGLRPILNVDSCYISDMFSFCTVIAPEEKSGAIVTVTDSVIYDVQDGIKLIVNESSDISCDVLGCHIELVLYEPESTSHGVCTTAGIGRAFNNYIFSNHVDLFGFSMVSMKRAELQMNLIETTEEETRSFSLGQGVALYGNLVSIVNNVEVIGIRSGFTLTNKPEMQHIASFRNCSAKSCAIGISVCDKSSQILYHHPNLTIDIDKCHFDTTHYGMMLESPNSKIQVENSSFYDVPKPILIRKSCSKWVDLKENDYKIADFFKTEADEPNEAESIRRAMFLHFAANENLPHRVAYDNREFYFVSNTKLERRYMGIKDEEPQPDENKETVENPEKTETVEKPEQTSEADKKPAAQVPEGKSQPEPVVTSDADPVLLSQ